MMWLVRQGNAGMGGTWGVRLSQEGRRDVWGSQGLPGGTRPGSASPLGPGSGELSMKLLFLAVQVFSLLSFMSSSSVS